MVEPLEKPVILADTQQQVRLSMRRQSCSTGMSVQVPAWTVLKPDRSSVSPPQVSHVWLASVINVCREAGVSRGECQGLKDSLPKATQSRTGILTCELPC